MGQWAGDGDCCLGAHCLCTLLYPLSQTRKDGARVFEAQFEADGVPAAHQQLEASVPIMEVLRVSPPAAFCPVSLRFHKRRNKQSSQQALQRLLNFLWLARSPLYSLYAAEVVQSHLISSGVHPNPGPAGPAAAPSLNLSFPLEHPIAVPFSATGHGYTFVTEWR